MVTDGSENGATTSPMARGSSNGSSPCTLTTMSQSSDEATSARRSVPVGWSGRVSRTLPPNSLTVVAIRKSSVATITRDTSGDASARRYTCSIIVRPSISASGLPGNRVEANRAGMTATMSSGSLESTREPVDAGRTTNNSTDMKCACYHRNRVLMDVKRTVIIGAAGGAIAVWIASAATSNPRPIAPIAPVKTNAAIEKSGAELAVEVKRLQERLRPGDTPVDSRDLFRYAGKPSSAASAPSAAPIPVAPAAAPPPVAVQPLRLEGLAEDQGDQGVVRTAIISGFGDIFLVKEGDSVTSRYRVAKISPDAVELTDLTNDTPVRLALR